MVDDLGGNDIKPMSDGDHLRGQAHVDAKGAKRLLEALRASMVTIG
jgi:hypothetical protein